MDNLAAMRVLVRVVESGSHSRIRHVLVFEDLDRAEFVNDCRFHLTFLLGVWLSVCLCTGRSLVR